MSMQASPAGREIRVVEGDHAVIVGRGQGIEDLGGRMIRSAAVLEAIANGADGQEGLSVEKIREVVEQIHVELALAGQRYEPSGTALKNYGYALERSQIEMRPLVESCRALWDAYRAALDELTDAYAQSQPSYDFSDPEAMDRASAERDAVIAESRRRVELAYAAFVEEARRFDVSYDTWESAFARAADEIGTATEGGVADDGWDQVDGIVDVALTGLQYVGIVLAIAAFVIGGPVLLLAGAIVALVVLALTLYEAGRGNAEWWEIALAVAGVIPFGSLAKFSASAREGLSAFGDGMTGGLGTAAGRADIVTTFGRLGDRAAMVERFGGSWGNSITASLRGASGLGDMAARAMGQATAVIGTRTLDAGAWGVVSVVGGHYGWIATGPIQIWIFGMTVARERGINRAVESWELLRAES